MFSFPPTKAHTVKRIYERRHLKGEEREIHSTLRDKLIFSKHTFHLFIVASQYWLQRIEQPSVVEYPKKKKKTCKMNVPLMHIHTSIKKPL